MQANATYMPPPAQRTAPILSSDRVDRTVQSLEPTVPLLHQANLSSSILASYLQSAQHQAISSSSMLRPPTSTGGNSGGGTPGAPVVGHSRRRTGGPSSASSAPDLTPAVSGRSGGLSSAGAAAAATLAVSAGYSPHLMSAGTLMPGGPDGTGPPVGVAAEGSSPKLSTSADSAPHWPGSLQMRQSAASAQDLGNAQLLVPAGEGSLRSQTLPAQSSLRAMLASQLRAGLDTGSPHADTR